MNVDYKLIGERIRLARKSKNMTQDNLAERLDVSVGYVSQVERGITKISLDLLGAISTALECDLASLVTESAVNSKNYVETELVREIISLDEEKRKFILNVIKLTKEL